MGNSGIRQRHRHHRSQPQLPHPQPVQPELAGNRYVVAPSAPYTSQQPNGPNPNPNSPYYPMSPVPIPHGHHHGGNSIPDHGGTNWTNGQYPHGSNPPPTVPFVEHQKAVTIRNDVNIKKESLRVEQDKENPGRFLVAFTFDSTAAGSFTVIFFAKEGTDCNLMATKESLLQPVTVSFQQGIGQKFRQPSGTGIDFSMYKEEELLNEGDVEVYPLAVRAEAYPLNDGKSEGNPTGNSQITLAVFEKKEKDDYQLRVKSQFLWVNGTRYELQEIYGIGNSVDGAFDENEPGKECIICLSEPQDTTVLPCRHMCMCSRCAKLLSFKTTRCPICRQPVEQLLEIEVSDKPNV